jgi:hypothetical protein
MHGHDEQENLIMLSKAAFLYADFIQVVYEMRTKHPDKDFSSQLERAKAVGELVLYINSLHAQMNHWKQQFILSQSELIKVEQAWLDTAKEFESLKSAEKW